MDNIEIRKVQNGYVLMGNSQAFVAGYIPHSAFIAKNLEEIVEILKHEPFMIGYQPKQAAKFVVEEADRPD